ncbi:MAG TPA: HAD family hydrolase [Hymenobacter sp.]
MIDQNNAPTPPRFDSVIFDLDGTMWDASECITRAFQVAKNSVDYVDDQVTLAQVRAVTGQPYEAVYERLFPNLPAEKFDEYRRLCARQELAAAQQYGGQLYPGLEATLRHLQSQGYRLFIVSNCQEGYVEAFFTHSRLEQYFEGYQCFGTKRQPKAENIRDVVAQYGLRAPVYVGDTRGDLDASQAAGVPFVFATYGFGRLDVAEAPVRIDRLSELPERLEQ